MSAKKKPAGTRKARKGGLVGASRALGVAKLSAPVPLAVPMDDMKVRFTWAEGGQAEVVVLFDNGVLEAHQVVVGSGDEIPYDSVKNILHEVRWDVFFPGRTLTQLNAEASKNGGPWKLLDEIASKQTRWSSHGVHAGK